MSEASRFPLSSRCPQEIIVHAKGGPVRVGELLGRASSLAASLPSRPYVLNLCGNRHEFLLGFCAAVIAGQCTLMPPNQQPGTLLKIAGDYEGCYVLGGGAVGTLDHFPIAEPRVASRLESAPLVPDDQLCAILFTSGSTGDPQPNRKSWRTLRSGADTNARLLLGARAEAINLLATVPPQHMWGFESSILLPLFAGVAVSESSPVFPKDIYDALEALARPRALVSSPIHLTAFLDATVGRIDIDYIFTATAPMSTRTALGLEARHGARVVDIFGSSESGMLAVRQPAHDDIWTLADAFGLRVEGAHTYIVADHLEDDVRLSDRVEILGEGRFRWIGRDEDMINIAGKRGSLTDINGRLNEIRGVEDGVIFLPEPDATRLAALVVAPSLQPSDILDQMRDRIDPVFLPRPVYIVASLPRQETSKLPRQAVIDLYEEIRQQRRTTKCDESDTRQDD
ncbi:MAG TPA: AMP-binding protein [Gammaproteobacteria bacterium]|nr:AMP-binding protein [Gammaproteobacteria bacterium]